MKTMEVLAGNGAAMIGCPRAIVAIRLDIVEIDGLIHAPVRCLKLPGGAEMVRSGR